MWKLNDLSIVRKKTVFYSYYSVGMHEITETNSIDVLFFKALSEHIKMGHYIIEIIGS